MNQVFKNKKVSRVRAVKNILAIWDESKEIEQYDWYQVAYENAVINTSGKESDVNKYCGLLACFSPLKSWDQNIKLANEYWLTGDCGHMKSFKAKAARIMASEGTENEILKILNGQKISSFFLNIRYPEKSIHITIDRHAVAIIFGKPLTDKEMSGITAKQYLFFSSCYRHAATKIGVNPLVMQSATWLTWRRLKKSGFQRTLSL